MRVTCGNRSQPIDANSSLLRRCHMRWPASRLNATSAPPKHLCAHIQTFGTFASQRRETIFCKQNGNKMLESWRGRFCKHGTETAQMLRTVVR